MVTAEEIAAPLYGKEFNVDAIVNLLIKYGHYMESQRSEIREQILEHAKFGTAAVLVNGRRDRIAAYCRWNFIDPWVVEVLDCVVHPKCRGKGLVRILLNSGLATHPWVKRVVWKRVSKYPYREPMVFKRKGAI